MGIDYDSKLVIGWLLPHAEVIARLCDPKERGCRGDEPCVCCCVKDGALPSGWVLQRSYPYFDCPLADQDVSLTLKLEGESPTASELREKLGDAVLMKAGQEIATSFGINGEATVFSLPHVW